MPTSTPPTRHSSKRYFFVFLSIFALVLGALSLSGLGFGDLGSTKGDASVAQNKPAVESEEQETRATR